MHRDLLALGLTMTLSLGAMAQSVRTATDASGATVTFFETELQGHIRRLAHTHTTTLCRDFSSV